MHTCIATAIAIAVATSNLLSRYRGFNYRYQHSSVNARSTSKLFTYNTYMYFIHPTLHFCPGQMVVMLGD